LFLLPPQKNVQSGLPQTLLPPSVCKNKVEAFYCPPQMRQRSGFAQTLRAGPPPESRLLLFLTLMPGVIGLPDLSTEEASPFPSQGNPLSVRNESSLSPRCKQGRGVSVAPMLFFSLAVRLYAECSSPEKGTPELFLPSGSLLLPIIDPSICRSMWVCSSACTIQYH